MSTLLCAFSRPIADELNDRINRRAFPDVAWSNEQVPILDWFAKADPTAPPTLVVTARAGTGKTTTIMGGVARAPESRDSLTAKTIHSLCFGYVRNWWKGIRLDQRGRRPFNLTRAIVPTAPDDMITLITKLHTKGREMAPLAESGQDLLELALRFDCDPPEEWESYGWTTQRVCEAAYRAMELAAERPKSGEIDFTDMLYLPIRNDWLRPEYNLVVVDEGQDMNVAQIIASRAVCRGRYVVVGDDRQTIFTFRGADSGVLDRIASESGAARLTLRTTYRCAKSIVRVAQKYVPDFVAAESNPAGIVDRISEDDVFEAAKPGDFLLSRINAPLVRLALRGLRQGLPVVVAGRGNNDVAGGLKNLIKKLAKDEAARSMSVFLDRLDDWSECECRRARRLPEWKRRSRIENIEDKAECIRAIADGVASVSELHVRLEQIFAQIKAGRVILLSSVHKAKGLEANRVFVLSQSLNGNRWRRDDEDGDEDDGWKSDVKQRRDAERQQEEENIAYVAVTRAMSHLTMVDSGQLDL